MSRIVFSFALLFVGSSAAAEEPDVFRMPKDEDVFFKSYFYTRSEYIQFSKDASLWAVICDDEGELSAIARSWPNSEYSPVEILPES